MTAYDCAIVGAGIHGLCAAFWLTAAGQRRLCVLDQYGPGHNRGSSHGSSRITRACYPDRELVAMADAANGRAWPALEQRLGRRLRLPTPGVFYGPADGPIASYIAATADHPAAELIDAEVARRRFPLLRFDPGDAVLVDHTAAVVLAATALEQLRHWLVAHGVEMRWQCRVQAIHEEGSGVALATDDGPLRAQRAIVAAGAWLPKLGLPTGGAPALSPRAKEPAIVVRQQVGYFALAAEPATLRAGEAPVWCRIGRGPNEFVYGLPDVDGRGVKAARHRTEGDPADPDVEPGPIDEAALLELANAHFAPSVLGLQHREHCLYTMASGQRLHVGVVPGLAAVVCIAACSGHAFKFGPLLGEQAAQLALAR